MKKNTAKTPATPKVVTTYKKPKLSPADMKTYKRMKRDFRDLRRWLHRMSSATLLVLWVAGAYMNSSDSNFHDEVMMVLNERGVITKWGRWREYVGAIQADKFTDDEIAFLAVHAPRQVGLRNGFAAMHSARQQKGNK